MEVIIHAINQVAGGYEYLYSLLDDDGSVLLGNQAAFAGNDYPEDADIDAFKQQVIDNYEPPEAPPEIIEGTELDRDLVEAKYKIKEQTVAIIKANPSITREDLKAQIATNLSQWHGDYSDVLMDAYIMTAYNEGYISDPTYEALRDHIANTPIDILMKER